MGIFDKPRLDEYASVLDWKPQWDTGAPMPHVFANTYNTYLIYLVQEIDLDWNGETVKMVSASEDEKYALALVEFRGHTFRFGIATDEVFHGLPLWGKGLEGYRAHKIHNSKWLEEVKAINSVHDRFSEATWKAMTHYCLLFHDEIFEIIASEYKIEVFHSTFGDLAIEVSKRMTLA